MLSKGDDIEFSRGVIYRVLLIVLNRNIVQTPRMKTMNEETLN